ncbi:MAG: penicillin-binding protein 2 [Spirochaetota bacterium]|nr:penicillin-binding protein 2 [Spirochaetota bacterium]
MKQSYRFLTLSVCFLFGFLFTGIKLVQTTLFPDKRLSSVNYRISIPRGNIYDTRGRLIAGISSTSSLYVRPDRISLELKEYITQYLRSTGYFSVSDLVNFDKTNKSFAYIKRDMTPSILAPVELLYNLLKKEGFLKNDELGITAEESRFYPYPFLAPIIGILGRDGVGLYGVEYTQNKTLVQGSSVTLSLDAEISRIAYEELYRVVQESDANSGSVGIINVKTKEILALVQVSDDIHRPVSTSHIYEPGSVMKIFTAAFAMEQGFASTESPTFDDFTSYKVADYTFSQPKFGYIPLSTMLTKSANISFARLSSLFGINDYYLWLLELGFGKKPNLPLTSIEKGILHEPSKWTSLSKPMIAIGQEIGVTTLQLLIASSVIGGQGVYKDPQLITSIRNSSGEELYTNNISPPKQLLHPQKAKELLYAMESVVSARGTGAKAVIDGVRIGGKTGTGMIAGQTGYSIGKNNTIFIGILPIEDPNLAIVVAIHNPKGNKRSGGGVSAPLFANIVRRIVLSVGYQNTK